MNKETIRDFIVENFLLGDGRRLSDSTPLLEAHIIDSTGILEIVSFLEEKFAITIEDEELRPENLGAVENISSFLDKKLGGAVG